MEEKGFKNKLFDALLVISCIVFVVSIVAMIVFAIQSAIYAFKYPELTTTQVFLQSFWADKIKVIDAIIVIVSYCFMGICGNIATK